MSNQISLQANKLWGLVSAPTTAAIYKQALSVTWTILKETGKLLWLAFCVFLVAFDGFWHNSIRMGRQSRAWINKFDRTNDMAGEEMWEEIVSSTRSSFSSLVTKARKQLGLYSEPDMGSGMSSASSAIVPSASAEIAPISAVSPMKRYEAASEDEPVVLSGGFMANGQGNSVDEPLTSSEGPTGTIETNAEPETVAVQAVSPKQKEKVGEDEEVEHSPLKDVNPSVNS